MLKPLLVLFNRYGVSQLDCLLNQVNPGANMRPASLCLSAVLISCAVLADGWHQRQASASRSPDAQASPAGQGATATSAKAPSQSAPSKSSTRTLDWADVIEAEVDPAVVTDAGFREAIKATGLPWRVRDKGTKIEMLLIPPGEFVMGKSRGDDQGEKDEIPAHDVKLTKAFYLGRYEVTQAQWQARMGSNPSVFQSASAEVPAAQVPNRPVEQVSWNTIQGFLAQTGMRLPTEAEWEYAYRAGTTTTFHGFTGQLSGTNDDSLLGNIAWFDGNSNNQTRPVGGKLGNGYGLHDMSGNVYEWVNDWWSSSYYSSSPQNNPSGPATGSFHVFRGGSWVDFSYYCRASVRISTPDSTNGAIGLRVARTP